MNEANFQNSLQAFVRRRPFKPFAVELMSGDRFAPEALAMRGAVAVYIDKDGKYTLFDSTSVAELSVVLDRASA